jgi:hypothetical protein
VVEKFRSAELILAAATMTFELCSMGQPKRWSLPEPGAMLRPFDAGVHDAGHGRDRGDAIRTV